jgi:hypothetical protein
MLTKLIKLVRFFSFMARHAGRELKLACFFSSSPVQEAARARKDSFTSSNPLSLGGGGLTPRGANMKTPLGWITEKLTGVGAR